MNPGAGSHRFAGFAFDDARRELVAPGGEVVALRPQVEMLLRVFLDAPGRLLGRDELVKQLWPQAIVTDDSLVQCIGELRAALGDTEQRFIRTCRGRGYRWDMPVQRVSAVPDAPATSMTPVTPVTPVAPVAPVAPVTPVTPMTPAAPTTPFVAATAAARRWRVPTAIAAALALLVVGALVEASRSAPSSIDASITAASTVAVLPFSAAADDPAMQHLAVRAADAVAAQFVGRVGMRVLGRSVTAAHLGQPPTHIGRALKARWVLAGHVVRHGDTASIEVQMQSAKDGSVGWSKRVDASADDPAALVRLGQAVVNAVRFQPQSLRQGGDGRFDGVTPAARLTLLGWNDLDQPFPTLDDLRRARERFETSLRSDASSLIARNGLAASYSRESAHPSGSLSQADVTRLEELVERTLEMAPSDPTALLLWGSVQTQRGRPELAVPALERAVEIAPSYSNGYVLLADAHLAAGRPQRVRALTEQALERSEGDMRRAAAALRLAAEAAFLEGDSLAARAAAERAVALLPTGGSSRALLAAILAADGDEARAKAEMADALQRSPTFSLAVVKRQRRCPEHTHAQACARLAQGYRTAGLPTGEAPAFVAATAARP